MSARRQASLYYARKRRRSLAAAVQLHRTVCAPIGTTLPSPFTIAQLSRGVTFKTKIDLSAPMGELFSLGDTLIVERTATAIIVTWHGQQIANIVQPTIDATWDFVLSLVPGTSQHRIWNQFGELSRGQVSSPSFTTLADPSDQLEVSSILKEGLSVYACQVPRHFHPIPQAELAQIVDNLLFNLTANHFLGGFQQPLLEP